VTDPLFFSSAKAHLHTEVWSFRLIFADKKKKKEKLNYSSSLSSSKSNSSISNDSSSGIVNKTSPLFFPIF